jgi:hypothetical protein
MLNSTPEEACQVLRTTMPGAEIEPNATWSCDSQTIAIFQAKGCSLACEEDTERKVFFGHDSLLLVLRYRVSFGPCSEP